MAMTPRVRMRAEELLKEGRRLTKFDLAAEAPCDHRTAQRVLAALDCAYVCAWVRSYRQPIPEYAFGDAPSVPRPKAQTTTQRNRRRRREDPELRIREAMTKRKARFLAKVGRHAAE